jgi:hypothetical protein
VRAGDMRVVDGATDARSGVVEEGRCVVGECAPVVRGTAPGEGIGDRCLAAGEDVDRERAGLCDRDEQG